MLATASTPRKIGRVQPWREGGTGGDAACPVQPEAYPYRLEAGTPNVMGLAGLRGEGRIGLVSLNLPGLVPAELAAILDSHYGIASA